MILSIHEAPRQARHSFSCPIATHTMQEQGVGKNMSPRTWKRRRGLLVALLGYQADRGDGFWANSAARLPQQHQLGVLSSRRPTLEAPVARRPRESRLKAETVAEGRTTSSGTSSEQRTEDEFEQWAGEAGIKAPKLRHEVFPDDLVGDLRGLKAVEVTAASEQLVTVPSKASISLTASEPTPFRSWVSPEFWDSQQWYVKLALKLLWERQLGSASAVEGYVNVLPAQGSFDTLIHWTDQELDALEYPKCAASAKRQRAAWDKLHRDLVALCPEGAGRTVTKEDLVWALECVLSRAFNGRFGGGQKSVVLSAGLLVASGAAYAFTEQPAWALLAALALLPLTLPELGSLNTALTGKEVKSSDYVLVPFVDSMNHVTSATTELSFSPVTGDLGVSVNRGYRVGEQAYISYGLKSNDELLQFYGFVEADCPADTYVVVDFPTKLDELGIHADTSVEKEVVFRRGPEVVSKETLEGLRSLLGIANGTGEGDSAVWRALRATCEAELLRVRPAIEAVRGAAGGGSGEGVRQRLAWAFRREKASVLDEAIRNLEGLERAAQRVQ